jgi:2-amino-4-ketopentanoate thiolase alpha subunit
MAQAQGSSRRWAQIGLVVLEPQERTARLPDDTKQVPYYVRVRGFLEGDANVGDTVTVTTLIGRRVQGELLCLEPAYGHSYGQPIEELMQAGCEARDLLRSLEEPR